LNLLPLLPDNNGALLIVMLCICRREQDVQSSVGLYGSIGLLLRLLTTLQPCVEVLILALLSCCFQLCQVRVRGIRAVAKHFSDDTESFSLRHCCTA
jgi:hypothetical protein